MKSSRLGWWFALAVIVPGMLLAGLAVRAIRREQAFLEKRMADALSSEVFALVSRVNEELARVQADLSASAPSRFSDSRALSLWRKGTPLVDVPFLLGPSFQVLLPKEDSELGNEERAFLQGNAGFISNRADSLVFENVALAYRNQGPRPSAAEAAPVDAAEAKAAEPPGARSSEQAAAPVSGSELAQQALSDFESQGEVRKKAYAQAEAQGRKPLGRTVNPSAGKSVEKEASGPLRSVFVAEPRRFAKIIEGKDEGLIPRFVDERLELLFWKRQAGGLIVGCRLDLSTFRERLLAALPQAYTTERILALLDDRGEPLFAPQERITRDYRRPFVAREVGELLPRWEAAAYLTDPQAVPARSRQIAVVLWALIGLLVVSFLTGGVLVLRALRDQVDLAREKTSFLAGVSHELKTPLTSIRMYAEMLSEGRQSDPERRQQYLDIIVEEAQRLTRLVNNVLDYAQGEQGKRKYEMKPLDAGEFCRALLEFERPRLEKAGFTLSLDTAVQIRSAQMQVTADSEAIRQALLNLISNAEKYSEGTREIRLELEPVPGKLLIRVMDRGRGIPAPQARRLFQEFYRAEEALTARVQGTGLGLVIARRIVRDHGGEIRYAPRPGGGSVFQIELPGGGRE